MQVLEEKKSGTYISPVPLNQPKHKQNINKVLVEGAYGKTMTDRCKLWIAKLRIGKKVSKYMVVCSLHFKEEDFFKGAKQRRNLKLTAVPSLNLPMTKTDLISSRRGERLEKRMQMQKKKLQPAALDETCTHSCDDKELEENGHLEADIPPEDIDAAETLIDLLNSQPSYDGPKISYKDFGMQANMPFLQSVCGLISTESALKSFTGLQSFELLDSIVSHVNQAHKDARVHKLPIKDRVILVFVKLKCDLTFAILSVLFGITPNLCKSYFCDMVKIIAQILRPVVRLPNKNEILTNMPACFTDFENTEIVVDCTEVFIQKPKCLCCRLRFYSHYKSSETVKFMTGVSPAGLITFISDAYGGRASDKAIYEQSGLISQLQEGSAIMVDKGFLIDDICAEHNIELYRPPFLRQKKQLTAEEAIFNRKIAAARIHIERCNQRIKIFKMLSGKFSFSLMYLIDNIFLIACAVTNLSSPILADDKFL